MYFCDPTCGKRKLERFYLTEVTQVSCQTSLILTEVSHFIFAQVIHSSRARSSRSNFSFLSERKIEGEKEGQSERYTYTKVVLVSTPQQGQLVSVYVLSAPLGSWQIWPPEALFIPTKISISSFPKSGLATKLFLIQL